jgi:putative spermidine/putrescine transport system permease protein
MDPARRPRVLVPEEAAPGDEAVPFIFRVGTVLALAFLLVPLVIVVLAGLNAGDYLTFPPQGLSLRWVAAFLTSSTFRGGYLLSLGLALMSALSATVIGTMAAIFLTRTDFPGRSLTRAILLSPLLLPGMVLGLALFLFYVMLDIGLARTLYGLFLGHLLVTTPYVLGTVAASLYNFDTSLEEAARALGAGPFTAFYKITLPIIQPGILAGSIFAFIVSFGQFDMSLFLSTPNLTPLPIALYISLRYKFEPTAAAAGVFAIFLVFVSMFLTSKLTDLRKFAGLKFR